MPDFVDHLFIIDDKSSDATAEVVDGYAEHAPERISLIRHAKNQGVGGAIATGYKAALAERFDITVVMAGDAQMDPAELPDIIGPVARGECDYTKGNRLFSGEAWNMIPRVRYLGNAMLSLLTKIASGYWHVADSQSGYTAISLKALETIDWDQMYKRYGQPNDLLVRLNIHGFRVRDVPIRPIYGIGEKSGIRPLRMIPRLSLLLHPAVLVSDGTEVRDPRFPSAIVLLCAGAVCFRRDCCSASTSSYSRGLRWSRSSDLRAIRGISRS